LFSTLNGKAYRYRLQGSGLALAPIPQAVETLRLYFIPYAAILTSDGDTLDGYNGLERLVVEYVFRDITEAQDLNTDRIEQRIARMEAAVLAAADGRDVEPFYLSPMGSDHDYDDWEPA
jgi:hypothetical protein